MISFWIFPGYAKVMKSNLKRANYYEICLTSKILVKALKRKKTLKISNQIKTMPRLQTISREKSSLKQNFYIYLNLCYLPC